MSWGHSSPAAARPGTEARPSPTSGEPGLKVLHLGKYYRPHRGGMETHLQALCEALRRSIDVEVAVASDTLHGSEAYEGGVKVSRLGTLFHLSTAPVCPAMVPKLRRTRADLVHVHLPNPTGILAYLASGHRGRLVVTYHSDIIRQKALGAAFLPILHRFLRRAAAIIATSPNYIESSPVLPRHRERCRVIPLGIPIERFQRTGGSEVEDLRRRFGSRIVITVGRLVYYKGFEHLIRAMAAIRGRLLIIGDGPLRSQLEREARERGVADKVAFLGEIQDEQIAPYYQASDVFALPSIARSEAFGIVQLEAMACGVPVVNTRLSTGVPFVSLDGVTGLTVPPADPDALAAAVNLLLDQPERRAEYGEAARRRVEREFTVEVMTRRTLDLYREVLDGPDRATLPP